MECGLYDRIFFRLKDGSAFLPLSLMQSPILENSIEFLKGVGPLRAATLKSELGVRVFVDLLFHLPFRYVDRSKIQKISEINSDAVFFQLKGKIIRVQDSGNAKVKRLVATLEDESGTIDLVWFKGVQWVKTSIKQDETYIVFGKPTRYKGSFNIPHPELEPIEKSRTTMGIALSPVYSTTEKLSAKGLNSKGLERIIQNLLPMIKGQIPEILPEYLLHKLKIPGREEAIIQVHAPQDPEKLERALKRLRFEELLFLQLLLVKKKMDTTSKMQGVSFSQVGDLFNRFYKDCLPFDLTGAQKRVLKEIRADVLNGAHMNRLIQGDVGSGKTIVALLTAILAIDNGYQACIMAPTEILANQHFESMSDLLKELPIKLALLTGSTKTAKRRIIHEGLLTGELNLLIGTHALIEPAVQFKSLGIAVIDEQHRFGVAQRASLWKKAKLPPHVLVMTATPIPRTLAMTYYGDLDVSVIDELPPGRKPIQTVHRTDAARAEVFGFMEKEIEKGRQIYVVYPLIETSEAMDYKDLMDGYESICRRFPRPQFQVSIVHGKMKSEAKEFEMARFVRGETQIMVATTVIEVGVNVPNASVMVIESAERFGLSQLHQLRGRVGRGAEKSYCILMSNDKLGEDARTRIQTMIRTNDGFEIAEVDLELRGPGDLLGTQQSGLPEMKIADVARDKDILKAARDIAQMMLDSDPDLSKPEHERVRIELKKMLVSRPNWSRIS